MAKRNFREVYRLVKLNAARKENNSILLAILTEKNGVLAVVFAQRLSTEAPKAVMPQPEQCLWL